MFRRLVSFFALGWRLLRAPILLACGALAGFLVPYTISLDHQLRERFDDLSWQIPSRVLARPLDLAPGRAMNADTLLLELDAARYRNDGTGRVPGSFARNGNHFEIARRAFAGLDGRYPAQRLGVDLQDGRISRLLDLQTGAALHQAELDPAKPARLAVQTSSTGLFINSWPGEVFGRETIPARGPSTMLAEKRGEDVSLHFAEDFVPWNINE